MPACPPKETPNDATRAISSATSIAETLSRFSPPYASGTSIPMQAQFSASPQQVHGRCPIPGCSMLSWRGRTSSATNRRARSRIIRCSSDKIFGSENRDRIGFVRQESCSLCGVLTGSGDEERPRVLAEVGRDDVAVSNQVVFVDEKALDADRTARVRLVCADADLGAEAVAEAIGKAGRGIPIDAGGIDFVQEALCGLCILPSTMASVCADP